MSKVDRKRRKLTARIQELQEEVNVALKKKDSSSREIDVGLHFRKILKLKEELNEL
jgi:tRNA 2-selenouridine synthase SelU